MRRLRYAGWWLVHEIQYALMMLGYRLRPYDSHLDRRRWRWQRSGCLRSRIAWRQHPQLARALEELVGDDGLTDHCGCCGHRRSTGCGGSDCRCQVVR